MDKENEQNTFLSTGDEDFFKKYDYKIPEMDGKGDEDFFKKYARKDKSEKHMSFFESKEPKTLSEEQKRKHEAFFGVVNEDEAGDGGADPEFFLNTKRDYVIEKVKKDGMHLQKAPMYDDDIEVVTLAVEQNGKAYQYASRRLREDNEVAKLFVDIKKVQIKEKETKPENAALITLLQQEIQDINQIHAKAVEEQKYHSQYMGMSM